MWIKDEPTLGELNSSIGLQYSPLQRQIDCEPELSDRHRICSNNFKKDGVCVFDDALFFMVRLFSYFQPMRENMVPKLQRNDCLLTDMYSRLIMYDEIAIEQLAGLLNVVDHLVCDMDFHTGYWERSYIEASYDFHDDAELIVFRDKDGIPFRILELFRENIEVVVLPISFFQHRNYTTPLKLFIPDPPPFPLYNIDKLAEHPTAPVIFTDELAIPLYNQSSPDTVFCSFYGGLEAISHLDISPLLGRDVFWLILPPPILEERNTELKTALKVAELFKGHNIKLKFVEFVDFRWTKHIGLDKEVGEFKGVEYMNIKQLVKKCIENNVYIPAILQEQDSGNITGDELAKIPQDQMILNPIIMENSNIILYGGAGVAKSWLALSLMIALSNGKSPFKKHWTYLLEEEIKCVYISGEMTKGEFSKRQNKISPAYCEHKKNKGDFIVNIQHALNIASPEGAQKVHDIVDDADENCGTPGKKTKIIVLDNITTLPVDGENPSNFGRIETLMRALNRRGIAVIFIHHENGSGDIRGARKISDVMDMKLHIYKVNEGDKISIMIKNEKNRSGKDSEVRPFKAVLDIDADCPTWVTFELTEKERDSIGESGDEYSADNVLCLSSKSAKLLLRKPTGKHKAWKAMTDVERKETIIKLHTQNCSNSKIADVLGIGKTTITNFRKKIKIRDCDLQASPVQD